MHNPIKAQLDQDNGGPGAKTWSLCFVLSRLTGSHVSWLDLLLWPCMWCTNVIINVISSSSIVIQMIIIISNAIAILVDTS